jgi:DNA repair exonuclease SbcCD ATPase subunit
MNKRLKKIAAYLGGRGLYKEAAELKALAMEDEELGEMLGRRPSPMMDKGPLGENMLGYLRAIEDGRDLKDVVSQFVENEVQCPSLDDVSKLLEDDQQFLSTKGIRAVKKLMAAAEAQMEEEQAQMEEAQAQMEEAQAQMKKLQAQMKKLQAQMEEAEEQMEKYKSAMSSMEDCQSMMEYLAEKGIEEASMRRFPK